VLPGKRRRPVAPTQCPPLPKPARSVPKGSVVMVTEVNVYAITRHVLARLRIFTKAPTGQGRHLEV